MPPAPPSGGGQGGDNHMAPLWIVVGLFVVIGLVWVALKTYLIHGIFYVKLVELDVVGVFTNVSTLKAAIHQGMANASTLTFDQMAMLANQAGEYIMIPLAVFTVVLSIFLFRKSVGTRFRKTYSMKSLLKEEVKNWPQTTPIHGLDLVHEDLDRGPWAMSKTPMQFAKKNQLLKKQRAKLEEGMLSREAQVTVALLKPKARQFFVRQLGKPWRGIDAMNMHTKAIFAVCAAWANDDSDVARKILLRISSSAQSKKLNFTGVRELIDKHRNSKIVKRITQHHAYEFTVMAMILEVARSGGVLATADFLWLKIIDRRLWFVLNSVGRQTPCVEASGAFSHWLFEKGLGRKVKTPMVDKAVEALDGAISEVLYIPDEDSE